MNHNHRQQRDRHEHDDLIQMDQAIRDKQLTGNRTIDRLIATVPRPDASRRDALEAYLVAQLTPESERKESDLMDMPIELKRKNKPKPRRRGRNIGIAAVVTVVLTTLAGLFIFPRPTLQVQQFGYGFLTPENTPDLSAPALLMATALSADATRDAGTASASNITENEGNLLTATAIIRQVTLEQLAPTLTAIDAANARLDGLDPFQATATKIIQEVTQTAQAIFSNGPVSDDEMTATALIGEVTQAILDQTAQASGLSPEVMTATAIIRQATQVIADATAQAVLANQPKSDDELTATALIGQVTQAVVDQTATAIMIFGSPTPSVTPTLDMMFASPVPLATPTPDPNLSTAPQTIHIPLVRMVVYDDRTQAVFVEGQRLLLFTELRYTAYEGGRLPENPDDPDIVETPLISSTARIVKIHEGPVSTPASSVPLTMIEVQVDASEYTVLKWFVENTGLPFLFIASPIVTVP